MVKIGKVELGMADVIPRVAVAVTDTEDIKAIKPFNIDILEIRIDQFRKLNPDHIRNIILNRKKAGLPLILTVRNKEEGGQKNISALSKLNIFRKNISLVDAVDIELKSPVLKDVVKLAKKNKKTVIISWHTFISTPSDKFLKNILIQAKKNGADIVKIAAKANKSEDIIRLAKFTSANKNKNLITVSLGALGSISRLIFPKFGSLITYSYVTKPSGTGQIPLEKLQEHLRLYYPKYNQS
ncbi:MAG: type I 3-dehydroquinate dehydratase [Elusimicrobiota bacterium]|nr:type I 3-dehydroquinate dehydratase [Elusimicrobiota bacterium]